MGASTTGAASVAGGIWAGAAVSAAKSDIMIAAVSKTRRFGGAAAATVGRTAVLPWVVLRLVRRRLV